MTESADVASEDRRQVTTLGGFAWASVLKALRADVKCE